MGAFRDPSTINNVGAVGSTTNPLTGPALGMERENQKAIKELIGTQDWESLSILDGGITPVSSEIIVDTEDGTSTDDLTTINLTSDGTTTLHTGMRIKIKSADTSRVITVKHLTGGGNIRTADGQDVVLSNDWSLDLKLQNGEWVEQKGRGYAMATEALGQLRVQGAALGEVQAQGTASWSADGAPYPVNAQVYHNGKQWLALRANSVEPAVGADWAEFSAAKYEVGEFYYFRHPTIKPGFAPLQGGLINGNYQGKNITEYPIWAYLQTEEGQKLCTTEAEWQAMTTAIWHTNADGSQVGWNGIGGAPFFAPNWETGALRLPDLRGMYAEAAGFDSLGVGGTHGDGMRLLQGGFSVFLQVSEGTGIVTTSGTGYGAASSGRSGKSLVSIDSSFETPTANQLQPRAWGALACVYLG